MKKERRLERKGAKLFYVPQRLLRAEGMVAV